MQEEQQSLVQQLKQQCSGMAAVLPFASTTIVKASSSTQAEIYFGLAKAVDVSGRGAADCLQLCLLLICFQLGNLMLLSLSSTAVQLIDAHAHNPRTKHRTPAHWFVVAGSLAAV
jgi:hypothetical protein